MELTIENPDINKVDEVFRAYIIQQNREYDYCLIKGHFNLILMTINLVHISSLTYLIIKQ